MKNSKRLLFQVRLQPEQVQACEYLRNECAYNVSELFRKFITTMYEEEQAKRKLA